MMELFAALLSKLCIYSTMDLIMKLFNTTICIFGANIWTNPLDIEVNKSLDNSSLPVICKNDKAVLYHYLSDSRSGFAIEAKDIDSLVFVSYII